MDAVKLLVCVCATRAEAEESAVHLAAVYRGLSENIVKQCGPIDLGRTLRVFLQDEEGSILGGVDGVVFGNWLYVKLLWVDAARRGRGHGTSLLRRMEEEAVRLGCRNAHLDTYSFEARPFYEKNGYEVFATLDDFPPGHQKHFLRKRLV